MLTLTQQQLEKNFPTPVKRKVTLNGLGNQFINLHIPDQNVCHQKLNMGSRNNKQITDDKDLIDLINLNSNNGNINKDFNFANEAVDFPQSNTPQELKVQLHEKIYRLIQFKFAEYLNLLYIIDVPEETVKQLDGTDLVELSEQVSFLILKREWMKVWFRNHY